MREFLGILFGWFVVPLLAYASWLCVAYTTGAFEEHLQDIMFLALFGIGFEVMFLAAIENWISKFFFNSGMY